MSQRKVSPERRPNTPHSVVPAKAGISNSQSTEVSQLSPKRLLELYDRVAEAPDAINRLRRFVLDLAVRGKLVKQDPEKEPASGLLKRLAKGRTELVKSGTIRKPRKLSDGNDLQPPFDIPSNWRWCRLDAVGAIIGGGTPSAGDPANFAEPGKGIPWLTPADLGRHKDLYIDGGSRDLSEKGLKSSSATMMPAGTVLFTSRAPIGYVAIATNPISTNQGFKSIVPFVGECSRFIALVMRAFAPEIDSKSPGTTFKEVSGKIVAGVPFPLPSLAEQHRIVARVDELMALLDRLESARTKREATRDRLTTASLARLTATDTAPENFPAHARFALDALPALMARPDQIRTLRQTILNLAVRGKLVEQNPADEPAKRLLDRIFNKKMQLIEKGLKKKSKSLPPADIRELEIDLPNGWSASRLGEVYDIRDGTHDTPKYVENGVPLVTSKNLSSGTLSFKRTKTISFADHEKISQRSKVDRYDILFAMIGSIGNPVIVNTDQEFSIKNVALFKCIDRNFSCPEYLRIYLEAASVAFRKQASGGLQPFVSLGKLRNCLIPLPPLKEQRRIARKVSELMTVCDGLDAALTAKNIRQRRLLEIIVNEALALDGVNREAA